MVCREYDHELSSQLGKTIYLKYLYADVQRPSSTISHRTLRISQPISEDASPVEGSGSDEDARSGWQRPSGIVGA